jgi:hypothetical protein
MEKENFAGLKESIREAGQIRRGQRKAARESVVKAPSNSAAKQFWAVCVATDDPALLIPRKLYLARPVGPRVSVIDEAGEPTACPREWFLPVSLSIEASELVKKAA